MIFPDRRTVESIRRQYPAECRIVLDAMEDPYSKIPVGAQGSVRVVDDMASVIPAWDRGGSLSVLYGVDRCHKIGTEAEAKVTLDWYGKHQPEENSRCPRCGKGMPGPKDRQALSRYAEIMVCSECGNAEALEKAGITEARPLMKWFCIESAQRGDGPWKG